MPTQPQEKPNKSREKQEWQQLRAIISKHVIHALGEPRDLHSVQVRYLWEDHYRVNIVIGNDMTNMRVAHSYFLVADNEGNIVASTPKIMKKY